MDIKDIIVTTTAKIMMIMTDDFDNDNSNDNK